MTENRPNRFNRSPSRPTKFRIAMVIAVYIQGIGAGLFLSLHIKYLGVIGLGLLMTSMIIMLIANLVLRD